MSDSPTSFNHPRFENPDTFVYDEQFQKKDMIQLCKDCLNLSQAKTLLQMFKEKNTTKKRVPSIVDELFESFDLISILIKTRQAIKLIKLLSVVNINISSNNNNSLSNDSTNSDLSSGFTGDNESSSSDEDKVASKSLAGGISFTIKVGVFMKNNNGNIIPAITLIQDVSVLTLHEDNVFDTFYDLFRTIIRHSSPKENDGTYYYGEKIPGYFMENKNNSNTSSSSSTTTTTTNTSQSSAKYEQVYFTQRKSMSTQAVFETKKFTPDVLKELIDKYLSDTSGVEKPISCILGFAHHGENQQIVKHSDFKKKKKEEQRVIDAGNKDLTLFVRPLAKKVKKKVGGVIATVYEASVGNVTQITVKKKDVSVENLRKRLLRYYANISDDVVNPNFNALLPDVDPTVVFKTSGANVKKCTPLIFGENPLADLKKKTSMHICLGTTTDPVDQSTAAVQRQINETREKVENIVREKQCMTREMQPVVVGIANQTRYQYLIAEMEQGKFENLNSVINWEFSTRFKQIAPFGGAGNGKYAQKIPGTIPSYKDFTNNDNNGGSSSSSNNKIFTHKIEQDKMTLFDKFESRISDENKKKRKLKRDIKRLKKKQKLTEDEQDDLADYEDELTEVEDKITRYDTFLQRLSP